MTSVDLALVALVIGCYAFSYKAYKDISSNTANHLKGFRTEMEAGRREINDLRLEVVERFTRIETTLEIKNRE